LCRCIAARIYLPKGLFLRVLKDAGYTLEELRGD